ncbi:MAG: hypothetical protein ACRD7E_29940 [Bryobacteraceae bacterium]
MRRNLISALACMVLGVGTASYAQQEGPAGQQQRPSEQQRQRQDEGTPISLKGCLTKGSQAQEYVLADEKSGQNVTFSASSKLDTYVNQTVELTGQIVEQGGQEAFQPQSIKPISSSCSSGGATEEKEK